jgi:hypothetical protein
MLRDAQGTSFEGYAQAGAMERNAEISQDGNTIAWTKNALSDSEARVFEG